VAEQHEFLSPGWMDAVRKVRDDLPAPETAPPITVKMNVVVTGSPFEGGDLKGHVDTSDGELVVEEGHLDTADLTVTVDYPTAKAIFVEQDLAVAMQAFMAGKVKVQGDITKLMALQAQNASPDPHAAAVATAIKDLTAP
jgi:hypothetical protein